MRSNFRNEEEKYKKEKRRKEKEGHTMHTSDLLVGSMRSFRKVLNHITRGINIFR